jgi:hypothetical protein
VPRLFKYTKREHVESLLRGSVWLGTLSNYADLDGPSGEAGEGSTTINVDTFFSRALPDRSASRRKAELRNLAPIVSGVEPRHNVVIANMQIVHRFHDCYLYCTTTCPSERLQRQFGPACIEILDPRRFHYALERAVQAAYPTARMYSDMARCLYKRRGLHYSEDAAFHTQHAYRLKPPRLQHECEYRFAYQLSPVPAEMVPQSFQLADTDLMFRQLTEEEHAHAVVEPRLDT